MQAEYDVTPDDLLALTLCHQAQSPEVRRQFRASVVVGTGILLALPSCLVLTSRDSRLETAIAIWPLWMGLFLFPLLYTILRKRGRSYARRIFTEAQSKFLDHRVLTLQSDGLQESMSMGSNHRFWTSIQRILRTRDHAFLYTSGIEAIILPRQSFSSAVPYDEFLQEISRRSGVEIHDV